MALVTHQMQGSYVTYPSRPLSWSKGLKLKQYIATHHMVGRTDNCIMLKRNICLSVGASLMRGSKVKPLRVSAFKGSAQNDKSGGRTSGSKLPKNSVKLKENEDTLTGSPQENDMPLSYASEANESIASSPVIHKLFKKWLRMLRTQSSCEVVDGILEEEPPPKEISETEHDTQNKERDGILRMVWSNFLGLNATIKIPLLIFIPGYLAVNIIYGAEVSKELTPLWVLGPLIVALYIKMLQWLCALYVFSFKQTVQVIKNLPTYYMVAYRYIAQGKLKEDIRARLNPHSFPLKNPPFCKMAASSACLVGNGLSTHSTKQTLSKDFSGRHLLHPSALPSLGKATKTSITRASLDQRQHEGRRGFLKLLLGNVGVGAPALLGAGNAMAADDQGVSSSRMSYSRFLEYLDKGRVTKVDLFENGTIAIVEAVSPELGNRLQRVRVQLPGLSQELLQKFREKNIDFAAHNAQEDSGSLLFNLIGNLAFPLILIGGLFLLSRRSSGGMGGPGGPGFPLQFGQSKAKFQMEPNTGVTFDDVAGVDEAKQDFVEVVEFLKKPERFTAVGARIPKGVLLVGPPGTGKTLLAKAIAGEAGVPFFSISGSEFVEMFVGVGASRVRDLFKKAKENAPCIVFVDEIDAVGRQRGTGIGGGNDEREQTLNQLLTEMDGFEGNTGIIVVAATNRADILDSALLRPGRFDRQVSVDVPDIRGRTEILKVHASNKKFDGNVSLDVVAMRTPGFSGADLANLLNEAAILAGRRGKTAISPKEIDDSIDRIVAGMEGTVMTDGKSKSLVAYHEVGHAICGTLTPGHDAVQKVTLVPRGQARGLTWFIPADDPTLISKQQLFARIVGGLGGRAAEEVIFGEPEVTTGAAGDLQQITGLAKQMVTTFGMSDIGPWSLMDASQSGDVIMRMMARNSMSEKLAEDIDSAIKRLSDEAYEIALTHIRNNREAIDKIVEVLLEKETMTGDEFRALLAEFVEIPVENRVPASVPSPVAV